MSDSELSSDLLTNYARAAYQVGSDADAFILHIDQYSEAMFQLLIEKNMSSAAIITAYNPQSQIQSRKKNLYAHAALIKAIHSYGKTVIEGENIDPSGLWPSEKNICVLGMNLKTIRTLGIQFNQNAIVWVDHTAVPRLVLLR